MTEALLFMRTFRFRVRLRRSPESAAAAEERQVSRDAARSMAEAATADPALAPLAASARQQAEQQDGAALTDGAFQEVSGLEVSMDVADYLEGGRNDGVVRRAGRARYVPLTFRRGMFHPSGGALRDELWRWLQAVVAGTRPLPRYDGVIEVLDAANTPVATWSFERGLPLKVRGPELNARTGEIAIEELQIVHEGLRLE
ncbi:phage tail protein [Chitiniphilus purpureus]|uniref:Phage tail protein n=1 Tax=Chitiniphilus purpureus TaxID=2981137 RepID=A0ABY6DKB7_9NEIS|nr:phage tail protein [Chitiniphilus sp. CD1]UXY14688.1 phage tail protein [Chitiniphilus sp. CD1]